MRKEILIKPFYITFLIFTAIWTIGAAAAQKGKLPRNGAGKSRAAAKITIRRAKSRTTTWVPEHNTYVTIASVVAERPIVLEGNKPLLTVNLVAQRPFSAASTVTLRLRIWRLRGGGRVGRPYYTTASIMPGQDHVTFYYNNTGLPAGAYIVDARQQNDPIMVKPKSTSFIIWSLSRLTPQMRQQLRDQPRSVYTPISLPKGLVDQVGAADPNPEHGIRFINQQRGSGTPSYPSNEHISVQLSFNDVTDNDTDNKAQDGNADHDFHIPVNVYISTKSGDSPPTYTHVDGHTTLIWFPCPYQSNNFIYTLHNQLPSGATYYLSVARVNGDTSEQGYSAFTVTAPVLR